MSSILAGLRQRARKAQEEAPAVDGMSRIIKVPSTHTDQDGHAKLVTKWTALLRSHPDARPLRPVQAEILEAASVQAAKPWPAGMLGLVGVGAGKTLAFFLMPSVFDAQVPLLLVPADMISGGQLEADWFEWSQEYDLLPLHVVKGGRVPRLARRTLYVMSYAQLSQPNSSDVLRRLGPDLILSDEVHNLRAATAARTKRFMRFMGASVKTEEEEAAEAGNITIDGEAAGAGTRFVGMSGTVTGTSLKDYWHLARLALRDESFLPEESTDLKSWCSVLDADANPEALARFLFDPLVTWARNKAGKTKLPGLAGGDEVRWAYNYRMVTTPGVVATTSPSCDSTLVLTGWSDISFQGDADTEMTVPHAMKMLATQDELPNGMLVEDELTKSSAMRQLAMGFYYYWDWPDGEVDTDYVLAKKGWDGAVRQYLKGYSREGVDSPWLVDQYVRERVASGKKVSPDLVYYQELWDAQKHKPQPPTTAAWLDWSVILAAVEWSQKNEGFLWFRSRAVGEALQAFGIPTFWEGMPDPVKHRKAALSLNVFNKGKNLQAWDNQLYLEIPSDAKMWEQSLGRTHRAGQKSEVVKATIMQHVWVLRRSWRSALSRATYIEGTTGQQQRLCFSRHHNLDDIHTFDPKPY